jgi:hypothetical protein
MFELRIKPMMNIDKEIFIFITPLLFLPDFEGSAGWGLDAFFFSARGNYGSLKKWFAD